MISRFNFKLFKPTELCTLDSLSKLLKELPIDAVHTDLTHGGKLIDCLTVEEKPSCILDIYPETEEVFYEGIERLNENYTISFRNGLLNVYSKDKHHSLHFYTSNPHNLLSRMIDKYL